MPSLHSTSYNVITGVKVTKVVTGVLVVVLLAGKNICC